MAQQTVRDIIDTPDKEKILFEALDQYENRCRTNGTRKMSGYGASTELDKREKWLEKAAEVRRLVSELSSEFS